MNNFKLTIMFDGTAYHGWQFQNNALSVQEVLERAIYKVTGETTRVIGCSRTDTHVHAYRYVCNFFSSSKIPPEKFPLALNAYLPGDISVIGCEIVPDDFHARYSAKSKTYRYTILNSPYRDPFYSKYAWHYPIKLDFDAMKKASKYIVGKHDFAAFMASGSNAKTTVRNVTMLDLSKSCDIIYFDIAADGFLYNMVRIIAGTLVYVGNGKLAPDSIEDIILSRDRKRAGVTAPPEGLCLMKVEY